ncbi:MAG: hypothetical protein GYA23_10455 [Methanomicrobiales archaeon]|nr:hypothetical protein [Methanomicrobiales archaeon]
MHIAVKGLIGLVVLFVVASAGMAALGFCPPDGPWPQPPWCSSPGQAPGLPDLPAIPLPPTPVYGEAPAAQTGTPLTVAVEVAVPATKDPVTLTLNGKEYPMERVRDYYYEYPGVDIVSGKQLQYVIASGDKKTAPVATELNFNTSLRSGMPWTITPVLAKPGFQKGHVIMDAGGMIITPLRQDRLGPTYTAMREDGGEWFSYDYYWSYGDYTKPEILDEGQLMSDHTTADDLARMAQQVHAKGMKFFLLTELEWNLLPGEREGLGWDEFFKKLNEKWDKGGAYDDEMGRRLSEHPEDPEVQAYWDRWFEEFTPFMLTSADIAEKNNIEMLSLGKQLQGAMNKNNEKRWRELIKKVRAVYHGKITQTVYCHESTSFEGGSDMPWFDELDYITIYYYNTFSEKENPAMDELVASMESFNRKQFDPLYAKYKKPLIFILPFQSRDHAAEQDWFEPLASSPTVGQDLMGQADLYEAFGRSTFDEPWLAGVYTWGYWIEPGFNPKYSFEKSSSVRNKPASLVIRKWFALVNPA